MMASEFDVEPKISLLVCRHGALKDVPIQQSAVASSRSSSTMFGTLGVVFLAAHDDASVLVLPLAETAGSCAACGSSSWCGA